MLHKVILQLDPGVYGKLKEDFTANRGEKLLQLMELYRKSESRTEINAKHLEINAASFYTLKSRLQDKVQRALFDSASDVYADLLKNLAAIPYIVNNTPRESAILLLEFLAEELKKADQPAELAQVYAAMKEIYSWSQDYYHYEQLYNKNIAYSLAIEKGQETRTHFSRECGVFCLSHNSPTDVLRLYIKELNNISRVYESHRIAMYRYVAEVTYALFVDENREIPGSELTVEETLEKLKDILDQHAEDRNYRYTSDIWHFLNYEYYTSLGLHKNANSFFEELVKNEFRLLYRSHRSLTSHILISAFGRIASNEELADKVLTWIPEPDSYNIYSRVNFVLFSAGIAFERGDYVKASSLLNDFLNDASLKNYFVAEYNIKLFLVLVLLCAEKIEQAEIQFRSISRKLASTEAKETLHNGVEEFVNLLKVALSNKGGDRKARITETAEALNKARKQGRSCLPHIKITGNVISSLTKLL
jgi:hypothetical protein